MAEPTPLTPEVRIAIQHGKTIEAIKLLRSANNLGLKEAKDLIDAYQSSTPIPAGHASTQGPLPAVVIDAMQRGRKVEAIRLLREETGMGLKEAKEAVEALSRPPRSSVVQSGGGNPVIWLLLLAGTGFLAYQFFAR